MRRLLIFLLSLIVSLLLATRADAHVLVTDNHIGAVLHIDPDDEPIAGQQSSFFFEFKDTQNKFDPQQCDCTFAILENGTQIYSQPLFQNNQNPYAASASVFYTFPKEDVYQVEIVGKPDTPNDFQPFTLVYDVRVDRIAPQTRSQSSSFFTKHLMQFIIGAVFIIIFVMLIVLNYVKSKKKDKGGEKNKNEK